MPTNDIDVAARIVGDKDFPFEHITFRGIRLKLSPIPSVLVQEVARKYPNPRPPVVFIEEKGREEENPNDPEYLNRLAEANYQRSIVILNVFLSGLEIVSIPDNLQKVEDTGWEEVVREIANIEIPAGGFGRRLAWFKYYAFTDDDLIRVRDKITRLSGIVLEEDVKEAEESFRDNEERPSD